MSLSIKGISPNKDVKLNTTNRTTTLNPNAAEFVPFSLRSASGNRGTTTATQVDASRALGKAILDQSESSVSNNSDDEAHQYWQHQLPDDITPDFTGEDALHEAVNLSLTGLSVHDGTETSRFATTLGSLHLLGKQQEISSHGSNDICLGERTTYALSTPVEDRSSTSFMNFPTNPWDRKFINNDQHLSSGREEHPFSGDSSTGFRNDMLIEHVSSDETEINPLEFLASQFPGFALESLAEVYYANGCDLNLTIEMLTQLEVPEFKKVYGSSTIPRNRQKLYFRIQLQVDGGFNQNLSSKTLSSPNLTALDFPALPSSDTQTAPKYAEDDIQGTAIQFHSLDKDNLLFKSQFSSTSTVTTDFASAVRKVASLDSSSWKYERNGSVDASVGTGRSSQLLTNSYNGHGKSLYGDRLQNFGTARVAPAWLETGEAVANIYTELRGEARDHARLRNAYFEQARQAYLIGNKALAKELSLKGQLHNTQMKVAHEKASESIYQQRNQIVPEPQNCSRGHETLIDLHGLHVSEAIHMLKRELSVLRGVARSAAQRLQVLICVGTGHHTKGSRTPARLPVAVEHYLLEEEGLEYTEAQPGLLRVMIH